MSCPVYDNQQSNLQIDFESDEEDEASLRCHDCNVSFTNKSYLLNHLLHHIKQPTILLRRIPPAPIRIIFKSKDNKNFEIVSSPTSATTYHLRTDDSGAPLAPNGEPFKIENIESAKESNGPEIENGLDDLDANVNFSPNFVIEELINSPPGDTGNLNKDLAPNNNIDSLIDISDNIPGAEPTPPPEPSPSPTECPKIRIRTGLLKEPLTITEITDDYTNGEYRPAEIVEINSNTNENQEQSDSVPNLWSTSCLEDPLKLPDSNDKDDSNLLSSFFNNSNDQAKAFGITSSDNEFISLDRLDDRNRNAMQVYNPKASALTPTSLDSLTGLPMQQLAEQVSRLQPSSGNMHQQNVLINIQQFPQAPPQPQHGYQPPPMYPPHPGMPGQHPPMYQPYQYQPPNHMYYPPAPAYPPPPPHMPPHPQQMPQPPAQQQMAPQQPMQPQQSMPPPQQPPQFRPQISPRAPAPRQYTPAQRPPLAPRQPMAPRQMAPRQRMPVTRPRGGMVATAIRGPRPRMTGFQNTNNQGQPMQRMVKRTPEQIQSLQAKKKRMDLFVPDKNDDSDCQVIAVQPKNTDGGLPQIQSVQGGTSDLPDNVMHLSDSITLSVRNPPPRAQSPKKSDAKQVANILATRGITVTATPKPKEKSSPQKENSQASVAINLNNAVSIIPTAKNNGSNSPSKTASRDSTDSRLPTVDLTDDSSPETSTQSKQSPQKANNQRGLLPFRCDLCPAQYPTPGGLSKHRQSYHKTGGPCDIGVPLIDLKQPGIVQKLTSIGIYNFIPLPGSATDSQFALPVVSVNAARNSSVCNLTALGASSILTLGPVRSLPKNPQQNNNAAKH